jgi:hypothetical protein
MDFVWKVTILLLLSLYGCVPKGSPLEKVSCGYPWWIPLQIHFEKRG